MRWGIGVAFACKVRDSPSLFALWGLVLFCIVCVPRSKEVNSGILAGGGVVRAICKALYSTSAVCEYIQRSDPIN